MILDLTTLQQKQKEFITWLESKPGMINEKNKFGVTKKQVLATISELYEVGNEAKYIYKWWDKSEIDKEKLLAELSDVLSHILNLANSLEENLVVEMELKDNSKELEDQLIELTYTILRFGICRTNKAYERARLNKLLIPEYITFVYSLGFTFENMDKEMWKYQILKEEEKLKRAELQSIMELPKYAAFVRKHEILWQKKRKDFNELEKECVERKYRELLSD